MLRSTMLPKRGLTLFLRSGRCANGVELRLHSIPVGLIDNPERWRFNDDAIRIEFEHALTIFDPYTF